MCIRDSKKIDQDYLLRAIRSAYNGESIIAPQLSLIHIW